VMADAALWILLIAAVAWPAWRLFKLTRTK
jgi:hypothetical protein